MSDDTPPVVDLDTPDQPNSWVAEVARRKGKLHPLLRAQQAIAAATNAAKKDKGGK